MALSDLQRVGLTGLLALAGLAAAGMIGANALVSYEQSQRAQIHFTPGAPTTIPDRRDCLNDQLKTMTKFNRQAIYSANVDCEQMIQSLEGHVEMGRAAKP